MPRSNGYLSPDILARITRLSLRAHRLVEGTISGQHRSPMHGVSVEFADYREYAPGDDLKRLDWRVYGRTNRFYIKEFEVESNLRCHLVMDASASMKYRGRKSPMTKYDYGATVVASLAMLMLKQRDAVGLTVFDQERRDYLPPSSVGAQLAKIVDRLESSQPDRTTELGDVINRLADQVKGRGMVIVVSDLLTNLDTFYDGLGKLQYRGHDILLLHVIDRDESELPFDGSVLFRDIEGIDEEIFAEPYFFREAYRQAFSTFQEEVTGRARLCGMDYLPMLTDESPGLALSHYLHRRQVTSGPRHAGHMSAFHQQPSDASMTDPTQPESPAE